jgi:hypothetical protein
MRRAAWIVLLVPVTGACSLLLPLDALNAEAPAGAADAQQDDAPASVEAGARDGSVPAGAQVWSGNGHAYLLVVTREPIGWVAARAAAERAGGHLVTTTSIEESGFVGELLDGPAWLGAYQDPSGGANEPGAGWRWVTDEPWGFTRWRNGEPNDRTEQENYAAYFEGDLWNDTDELAGSNVRSYVVEFEPD